MWTGLDRNHSKYFRSRGKAGGYLEDGRGPESRWQTYIVNVASYEVCQRCTPLQVVIVRQEGQDIESRRVIQDTRM